MSRMSMIYNGQAAEDLTKDELISAILKQYGVTAEEGIIQAMEEAFRCGFLRGEEYGKSCN